MHECRDPNISRSEHHRLRHRSRGRVPLHRAKPQNVKAPFAAIRKAEQLSRIAGNVGSVAFSRTGDPAIGEFSDAVVLKALGEVPEDLSEL